MSALPGYGITNEDVSNLIVDGSGEVTVPPDLVTIELGVETKNISSDVAAAENAKLMNKTVKALLSAGLREDEIQTSQFRLTMPYGDEELIKALAGVEQSPEYVAISSVIVKMNTTEDIGKILGAAIAAGSNNLKSVSYGLKDSGPQKDEALAKAVADARRKAEIIASSAGVELVRVLEISSGRSYYYGDEAESVVFAADGSTSNLSIPLQPKDVTVEATISITYEIAAGFLRFFPILIFFWQANIMAARAALHRHPHASAHVRSQESSSNPCKSPAMQSLR